MPKPEVTFREFRTRDRSFVVQVLFTHRRLTIYDCRTDFSYESGSNAPIAHPELFQLVRGIRPRLERYQWYPLNDWLIDHHSEMEWCISNRAGEEVLPGHNSRYALPAVLARISKSLIAV